MSDQQPKPDRTLSEISHLFLSSVRERQMRGAPLPHRRPPGAGNGDSAATGGGSPDGARPEGPIDLTPEEFAQVSCGNEPLIETEGKVPVQLLLGLHLGARQSQAARQYASYLAGRGIRVGLIEVEASEFRLSCFDQTPPGSDAGIPADVVCQTLDARRMQEALHELAEEIETWLVVCASRAPEARALTRGIAKWVLLASCDHDGIVAAYRSIKGSTEFHRDRGPAAPLPCLSLAVLDALDDEQADHVTAKLAAVCEQFLQWRIESRIRVQPANDVAEHRVLECGGTRDKAQLAAAPQWQVVTEFLKHLAAKPAPGAKRKPVAERTGSGPVFGFREAGAGAVSAAACESESCFSSEDSPVVSRDRGEFSEAGSILQNRETGTRPVSGDSTPEVLDLPADDEAPQAIVSAVLRGESDLIECPIHPPMCPQASLAVSRQRQIVLVAVARQGLRDLRAIAQGYRWLRENCSLVRMAMPQFAVDPSLPPHLHLLIDYADMAVEILQPMFESENVTVRAYRRLRWGGKTGLLLEAA